MNFLQKYDLKVSTRFGKNYVTVEDAAHIIHELEQTIQFLKLENNRIDDKLTYMVDDRAQFIDYYRNSRDKAWNEISETRSRELTYKRKYDRAMIFVALLTGSCAMLLYKLVSGY